jgi:O-antigen/teichoic acid export membrane protein
VRNSAANLAAQVVNALCNLIVVFVLARVLGKDLLGRYFTVFAVFLAVQMVFESGITTMLTCRIVQSPDSWRRTVAEATGLLALILVASIMALVVIGVAWSKWRDDAAMLAPFLAAGFACAALQVERFCSAVFRAFEQFRFENIGRVIQGISFASLVVCLCLLGLASPQSAMLMLGVSHTAAAMFLLVRLQQQWKCIGWRLNASVVKDWLSEGVPLGMGDVVRRLTWQLDTLLLGALQPAAAVGIYSVAYRPLGPLNWVPRAILTAAFPAMARMATTDRAALDRTFTSSTRLLWVISLPMAISICLCAQPIILFLAGTEYMESAAPMQILIWISTLSFLSIQFRFVFTAVGHQQLFARVAIAIFALEAVIECALIPTWGYMGACAGSLIGELAFTVGGLACCAFLGFGRVPWGSMMRAVLAGFGMGLVIWPGRELSLIAVIPLVVAALCVYVALCLLFGAIQRSELRQVVDAILRQVRIGRKSSKGTPHRAVHATNPSPLASEGTATGVIEVCDGR